MRTYVAKGREAEALMVGKDWFVVDAEGTGSGPSGDSHCQASDWQG